MKKRGMNAWYGFDLDGTLAYHEEGGGIDHVGAPIAPMVERVKNLLAEGKEVRIVTARVSPEWDDREEQTAMIQDWCAEHIGQRLPVQAHKNGGMIVLYDDRATGVVRNTGKLVGVFPENAIERILGTFYNRTGMHMDRRVAEAILMELFT